MELRGMAITKVAAPAYLMFNLYTPPLCGYRRYECRDEERQMGLKPSAFSSLPVILWHPCLYDRHACLAVSYVGAAIGGLVAVLAMAAVNSLIANTNKKLKKNI